MNNNNNNFFIKKSFNSNLKFENLNSNTTEIISQNKKVITPISKTWKNNVYSFNKHYLKHLPVKDRDVNNLIIQYFNMYNDKIEKLSRFNSNRLRNRFRRLSINRILVNDIDVKQTNSKVLISLSVLNSEKQYILNKYLNIKVNNKVVSFRRSNLTLKNRKRLLLTSIRSLNNKLKLLKYHYQNILLVNKHLLDSNYNNILNNILNISLEKLFKRSMLKLRYKYLLFLNESKFNNNLLNRFKSILEKIYNKNISFNIINLKYPYLSGELFSNIISMKIRGKKFNMRKVSRLMFKDLKLPLINKGKSLYNKEYILIKKTSNSLYIDEIRNKISLNTNYFSNILNNIISNNDVLNYINYKYISGIMIRINGKLSRKVRVSRSQSNIECKGSIKNIYSQYKHLSTPLNKGYLTSNIQYTNVNNKTRMGSYGIKGWISSV